MFQDSLEMSSDVRKFYDENREYVDDLSKEQKLCSDCTRRLDLHENDNSVCKSPWYATLHYSYIYRYIVHYSFFSITSVVPHNDGYHKVWFLGVCTYKIQRNVIYKLVLLVKHM